MHFNSRFSRSRVLAPSLLAVLAAILLTLISLTGKHKWPMAEADAPNPPAQENPAAAVPDDLAKTPSALPPLATDLVEAQPEMLNIIGMVPLPGRKLEDQIVLFFDDDYVLPTTPEGTPAPPFECAPELRGEFQTGPNYAAFLLAPGQDLPPNEYYDVRIAPGIRSKGGKELNPKQALLRVATFAFEPQRIWILERDDDQLVLGILFPVDVDIAALREHLSVLDGSDGEISHTLERGSSESSFRLKLAGHVETPIKLLMRAGLEDAAAQFTLASDRTFTYPADPFFHVTELKWGGRSDEWRDIQVKFSKPVHGEALKWSLIATHMTDQERIPFEIPQSGPSTAHRIRLLRGGDIAAVKISISGNLRGENETRLVKNFSEVLPPAPDPLSVAQVQWGPSDNHSYVLFLRFSSPIDFESLGEHLTILDEQTNAALKYTIDTRSVEDSHRIRIRYPSPEGPRIALTIADGLVATDKTVLLEPHNASLSWSPPKLYIANAGNFTRGRDGIVVGLSLNTLVNVTDLQNHLTIAPEIGDFRIVAGDRTRYEIHGRWKHGASYRISVSPGVKFTDGSISTNTAEHGFRISHVDPVLEFSNPGKCYFTMRDDSPLSVLSMGITHAEVSVHRVFPSNLVHALGSITQEPTPDPYGRESTVTPDLIIAKWSEEVASGQLELTPSPDEVVQTNLDLIRWFPPDRRGVFCLVAEYKTRNDDVRLRTTKLVTLTEIGALSHWQDDNIVLFAHNLFSLRPLPRAKVSVYSKKKQLLHMGHTDDRGIFQAGGFDPELGPPELAVIEFDNDTAFLELVPRKDENPAVPKETPAYDAKAYDGYLFTDRDLYRPGETVHLRWMVRTNYGDALANVPFELLITDPRNAIVVDQPTTLSAFGSGGYDFLSKATSPTGPYKATLKIPGPNGWVIGSCQFKLEEFVPNRMKVAVELPQHALLANTEYAFSVKAEHLFGASASDRKTSCEVLLEKADWKPEGWPGFTFANDATFTPDRVNCGEKQSDENGVATYPFKYAPPPTVSFPLRATVAGSIFELGGRVVTKTAETNLFPSDTILGIRANERPGGSGVEVHVAAVRPDGSPAAGLESVTVTLERQVWNYYVRQYYGNYESNWSDSYEEIETREVPIADGLGALEMDVAGYGRFRLRVHSADTPQYSTLEFHSYWYGGRLSFGRTEGLSLLKLSLDKKSYRPGDDATLLVESPFDGRGIVVVQGETIHEMIPFEIENNRAELRIPVKAETVPNLWLEVTALHEVKTDRASVYPFSSFAMTPLVIENTSRKLAVSFPDLPEEIRPLTESRFDLLVQDASGAPVEAELTFAAVDEGIHAITQYETPDPYGFFSRPRRADHRRAHYYDKVAYTFDKTEFGGGVQIAKRAQAIGENWIKPLALWSGVVQTDADGKATVAFSLPEFSGQLRLVAVACTPTASGSSDENIFVRRPFVLRTSMPRFLLPGDAADCAVALFNTTGQPARATVTWTTSGPLQTTGGEQRVDLPANGEARLSARFDADQAVGQGQIVWRAVIVDIAGNPLEDLEETAPLPIRPSSSFQSHHDFTVLQPGATQTFENVLFHENKWIERSISVTADPTVRLEPAFGYVVGYPHGCVEQTVSRLMSMYLFRSSRDMVGRVAANDAKVNEWIEAGVQKLFSMQTPNGGLSNWPGGYHAYPYGSLYALHFLTILRNDRQFTVPTAPYEGLQRYARTVAADWSDASQSHLYTRAYALYVLVLGGDNEAAKQIRRFDTVEMPQPARYLLAAALAKATQDSDRVKMYLSEMPSVPYAVVEQSASLSSDIRNTAVELLALRQIGGDTDAIHARAETLLRFLELHNHGNTQESALVVTALCEYLGELSAHLDNPGATIAGPSGTAKILGRNLFVKSHRGSVGAYTVTNTGQAPMFVNFTTRGFLKAPQLDAVRHGIGLERIILNKDGTPHDGNEFRQSDTYIVELVIHADRTTDNTIVVDMLPAGFEIENPRLTKNLPQLSDAPNVAATYTDIRDDRLILAFDHLLKGSYRYHYVVRAVTPGSFQYPAAAAECMYDAEINGASTAGAIVVSGAK